MFRILSSFLAVLFFLLFGGCASVESTSAYYLPQTLRVYPPKPRDYPVPILGAPPDRPYRTIGHLAFTSDQGWKFMRESMTYNARINGADAVILRKAETREKVRYTEVPPCTELVPVQVPAHAPVGGCRQCGKNTANGWYPTTTYVPVFQPGYTRTWVQELVSIDAEMIVF